MEHLTSDERELLAKARATQCWLSVNPATVVKLLEEIERLRAALADLKGQVDEHDAHYEDHRIGYPCYWDWDMKLADAALAEPQPLPARDQAWAGERPILQQPHPSRLYRGGVYWGKAGHPRDGAGEADPGGKDGAGTMKVYAVITEIKGVPRTLSIHATPKSADAGVKQAIADFHPPGARSWKSPNGQWCCEDKEYWVNVYEVLP